MSRDLDDELEMDISCCNRYGTIKLFTFLGLYALSKILKYFNYYPIVSTKIYLKHII